MRRALVLGVIVLTGVVTAAMLSAQGRGREGAQGREGGPGGNFNILFEELKGGK